MFEQRYPHLFSPISLAGNVFRNRIFASPTGAAHFTSQRFPIPETNAYYERKAIGGAASVCVGDAVIDSIHSRFNSGHIPLDDPAGRPALNSLSESIYRHGAVASIELAHYGSHAFVSAAEGSSIYGPMGRTTPEGWRVEAMTDEKICEVIEQFAAAAAYAKSCGFGMVTIHGGHGWLISEFLSPFTNRRTDRWGGSIENRCRFVIEICKSVRRAVGPKFPIEIRISGSECSDKGYDINEGIAIAKQLDGYVDLIHVSAGSHIIKETFTITHPDMFIDDGANVKYAAEIKKHVKTPVAAVGALTDPQMMEEIIASGQADVIEIARGLLADPDLPIKARTGREQEINKCIRCLSCFASHINRGQFVCAINPEIGHELENKWNRTPVRKKKVLIAGGGVAGMRAALTASSQGHDVILCEKKSRLGGVLLCEEGVSFKKHLSEFLERQAQEVKSSGIDLRLGTVVTPKLAREISPDVIIAAIGAAPLLPTFKSEKLFLAEDIYNDTDKAGQKVVIIGGGLVGAELAIHLARIGKQVTILELCGTLNDGGNQIHGRAIRLELERLGIKVIFDANTLDVDSHGAIVDCSGEIIHFEADTVVFAVGMRPRHSEAESLRLLAPEFHQIGDCLLPRNITEATRQAHNIAIDIGRY